jgi:hypothetical protein
MPTTTLITAMNTLLASGAGGVKGAAATARSARAVIQTKKARTSHEMLLLDENRGLPDFRDALRHAAGTVSVERYRVPVFEWDWEGPLDPRAGLRLTWMDIVPSRVEDAVEAYGDTVVPGWRRPRVLSVRCCSPGGAGGV